MAWYVDRITSSSSVRWSSNIPTMSELQMFICKYEQKPHSWERVRGVFSPIWLNSVTLCPWSPSVNVLLGECEVLPSEPQRQKREQILSWTFLISPLCRLILLWFCWPKVQGNQTYPVPHPLSVLQLPHRYFIPPRFEPPHM